MKYKSSKRKKPPRKGGFWLQELFKILAEIGAFLLGLAELLKVIFKLTD